MTYSLKRAGLTLALACSVATAQAPTFRTEARLVEVYATVFDSRGRYVPGIERERFRVLENGRPVQITAFESEVSEFSCAIVIDTTGSMERALPRLKNAVLTLIEHLRDGDAVAIYGFSDSLASLQEFTTDKKAAKQAVLRVRPHGRTALFDAVAQVGRDLADRNGKKAIVVFTDGQDNASVLNLSSAMQRARRLGVPVFSVAQGEALRNEDLVDQLQKMSQVTGAASFSVKKLDDIEKVFTAISRDLQHTYLLAYKPPDSGDGWRKIGVSVAGLKGATVRAKEGYLSE